MLLCSEFNRNLVFNHFCIRAKGRLTKFFRLSHLLLVKEFFSELIYHWKLICQYAGIGEEQIAFWGEINKGMGKARQGRREEEVIKHVLFYLDLVPFCVLTLRPFLKAKIILFRLSGNLLEKQVLRLHFKTH